MDGNKTFPSVASDNTGRRYKRETNLKFSEGTVEQYESFRSQFIIQHKMLCWSNERVGIELYMSLEGKAALKVEEVVMNAKERLTLPECGMLSTVHSFLSIIVNRDIGSLLRDVGAPAKV